MRNEKEFKWDLLDMAQSMLPPRMGTTEEYQKGWTDAYFQILEHLAVIEEWADTLGEERLKKVIELSDDSAIFIYKGHTPFFHEKGLSVPRAEDIQICVNCGDFFSLCCADSEDCSIDDIDEIYAMWHDPKYKGWGTKIWCAFKRNEGPHRYVWDRLQKEGVDQEVLDKIGYWERT